MTKKTASAAERYEAHRDAIADLIQGALDGLGRHSERFKSRGRSRDWGYVGDLNEIRDRLEGVVMFLDSSE